MKPQAFTVHQGWAALLAMMDPTLNYDGRPRHGKPVETRNWRAPRGLLGQPVWLHAGQEWYEESTYLFAADRQVFPTQTAEERRALLARGAFLAVATLADCEPLLFDVEMVRETQDIGMSDDEAAAELALCDPERVARKFGWRFADVCFLRRPVPCRGEQGLWTPPATVAELVEAQLVGQAVDVPPADWWGVCERCGEWRPASRMRLDLATSPMRGVCRRCLRLRPARPGQLPMPLPGAAVQEG